MMTENGTHDDQPNEASCLVVAALADGEPVDAAALRVALADPAVREYLIDLVVLRQSVGTLTPLSAMPGRVRRSLRSRVAWLTAAAAVVFSLTAGYLAGQRTVQAAPAPNVETVVEFSGSVSAPKPTRVVTLRPGVNWTEKVEGQ
jgi:hypothetical protein